MIILESIFLWVLQASLITAIVIAFLLCLLKLFDRHVGLKFRNIVWLILLIRLLIPIMPESQFNVISFLYVHYQNAFPARQGTQAGQNEREQNSTINRSKEIGIMEAAPSKETASNLQKEERYKRTKLLSYLFRVSFLIWAAGAFSIVLFLSIVMIRFKMKAMHFQRAADADMEKLLEDCKKKAGITKNIPIYFCEGFKSPCIVGLIRPKIFLPQYVYNTRCYEEFSHVLVHELIHYRRKDIVYNVLETAALILHWFNPIVWFMAKKARLDRECACDAYVLEVIGEEAAVEYGMTLLHFSKGSRKKTYPQFATFFETKNQVERRIKMIGNFKKGSYKISAAAVACCVLVGSIAFSNVVSANDIRNTVKIGTENSREVPKSQENQFLIDAPIKQYDNLEKASKVAGFKFKLPDYMPEGYSSDGHFSVTKFSDKGIGVKTYFADKKNKKSAEQILFAASNENIIEFLKKTVEGSSSLGSNATTATGEAMKLAGINGSNVTVGHTFELNSSSNSKKVQRTSKFFIWQEEGKWYAIQYSMVWKTDKSTKSLANIALDTVGKIAASIKYSEEIKNVSYLANTELSTELGIFEIYDKEDLERAEKLLGFTPKLPLTIHKDIAVRQSVVGLSGDSDISNKKIAYTLDTIYNAKNCTITLSEAKSLKEYEDIKKNGSVEIITGQDKKQQIQSEKFVVSGKEVFKYKEQFEGSKDAQYCYLWQENGFVCSLSFMGEVEGMEDIAKEVVAK